MINAQRGEIEARLDGRSWTLCLTLSSLAELEHQFHVESLTALAQRLSTGVFSADDLQAILHTGLKGGGHDLTREEVAMMRCEGGAAGYTRIVAELLAAGFGKAERGGEQKAE